jgi:hypothetical protein
MGMRTMVVETIMQDGSEIIINVDPKAKALFLLAVCMLLALVVLEIAAATPYDVCIRGKTRIERLYWMVGHDEVEAGFRGSSTKTDYWYVVNVKTKLPASIWVGRYILSDEGDLQRVDDEYHNVTEIEFESRWGFRVRVMPSVEGTIYIKWTPFHTEQEDNIEEWHSSWQFLLLCTFTVIIEAKAIGVVKELRQ